MQNVYTGSFTTGPEKKSTFTSQLVGQECFLQEVSVSHERGRTRDTSIGEQYLFVVEYATRAGQEQNRRSHVEIVAGASCN
jgi:hypothetical protein